MKVYISGPMSGYPQFNIPTFDEAAAYLRATNPSWTVVSPPEEDHPDLREFCMASKDGAIDLDNYADIISKDLADLETGGYDAIILLEGWNLSNGSIREALVAFQRGLKFFVFKAGVPEQPLREVPEEDVGMVFGTALQIHLQEKRPAAFEGMRKMIEAQFGELQDGDMVALDLEGVNPGKGSVH